jgi:capsular exopolysaccharide synthesis family protein
VVLVDADLRRPSVHNNLHISKAPGLSNLIRMKSKVEDVVRNWEEDELKVITAGEVPSNVTEVINSKRIVSIFDELKEKYELLIIDAPPLIISDSYNLASVVDGVLLIMVPGETSEEQARAIKEQLDRSKANLLGIVFNKISEKSAHSYYDYQYNSLYSPKYYGDYMSNATNEPNTDSRSKKMMDFFEHGQVPPEMTDGVESVITAIKTQPRNMAKRLQKSKKNGKDAENS